MFCDDFTFICFTLKNKFFVQKVNNSDADMDSNTIGATNLLLWGSSLGKQANYSTSTWIFFVPLPLSSMPNSALGLINYPMSAKQISFSRRTQSEYSNEIKNFLVKEYIQTKDKLYFDVRLFSFLYFFKAIKKMQS